MPISRCPKALAYTAVTITTAHTKACLRSPLVLVLLSNRFNLKALMYPETISNQINQNKI